MINLNDTTPVAINGGTNVHFQEDSSGNVSAYSSITKTSVSPVAGVVTLDASLGNSFWITVSVAITSMVINNPTDGQEIMIAWQQDTSGHAVAVASNLVGGPTISTTANKTSTGKWTYNAADTNWFYIGQAGM